MGVNTNDYVTAAVETAEYVSSLVERARKAQKIIESYSQEQIDALVTALAWSAVKEENCIELSKMALEESGMGNFPGKCAKITKKVTGVLNDLRFQKSVGIIEELPEKGIVKIAKPVGVVGALVPSTHPEMTPTVKAMFAVKARNAVVFSPHPSTKNTSLRSVELMREALKRYGAPEDLLICAENPTLEMSNEIMRQCDLVVATGGAPMVKAAYSSGTPAYGVGVGNSHIIIDETADLVDVAKKISFSQEFDNSSSCSSENSIIVKDTIYDSLMNEFKKEGGYLCTSQDKQKLQDVMWPDGHIISRKIVLQSAPTIAKLAGIALPEGYKFLLVEETGTGKKYPFSGEKLSPVLTVYKYSDIDEAINIINANHAASGAGHSCGIFSSNEDSIMKVALRTRTARVMVRQSTGSGNTGDWANGMPCTVSLGCGTWGGNIASENIALKHFMNTTWVSRPLEPKKPTMEELFGNIMQD